MKKTKLIFISFCCLVLFAMASVVIMKLAQCPNKVTKIKLYQAWVLHSEQLNRKLALAEELEGSCWTSSHLDPRPDAWRCKVGDRILDPCFSPNPTAKLVACSTSPWSKKISLIHLTEALPTAQMNSEDFMPKNPWALSLKHHEKCYPIGGATFAFAGMRNSYSCGHKGALLFGAVNCARPLCEVFYYSPGHAKIKQVPVKEIWY